MNRLNILTLKFTACCKKDCRIYQHMGNALRGALGTVLKKFCNESQNIYDYIFKNQTENVYADSFVYGKTNPFIIDCDYRKFKTIKRGEEFIFNITLLGNASNYGLEIIEAVKLMMADNMADNMDCFELEAVEDYQTQNLYYKDKEYIDKIEPCQWDDDYNVKYKVNKIEVQFVEPVVLKSKGKLLSEITFDDFFQAIIRRLVLIFSAYEKKQFIIDKSSFDICAKEIKVKQSNLKFYTFKNYSRTTDSNYPRKGLLGSIVFEGDLNKFLPYIGIGSEINIGKGTTIGMGKFGWGETK